jgi:hypothetical protein
VAGERRRARARRGRAAAAVCLVAVAVTPVVLWHDVVADLWAAWHLDAHYFLGWSPGLLMALGVAFFVPVALSVGAEPDSRFYPRARNAYFGWGITLYLLGLLIGWQVARLHAGELSGF